MRPGSAQGPGSRLRTSSSRWNACAKLAALVVICHILAVVILSAQSTAAGGPLVLFPLAALWRRGESRAQAVALLMSTDPYMQQQGGAEGNTTEAEPGGKAELVAGKKEKADGKGKGKKSAGKGGKTKVPEDKANIMPNPITLPILPKSPPPPPPKTKDPLSAAKQRAQGGGDQGKTQGKKELVDQLKGRRKEVERLMAKRRADREGITIEEAERTQSDETKERVDVAVLAVEKPQENVRESFNGGQNGRFLPAPKLLYNLFKKDDRPREDKSWLDRVTDSIIDKLELRWEDDEEARLEDDEEPQMSSDLQVAMDTSMTQRPMQKQWPADECANILKIPKVAMMYLTKGDLYHSSTWKLWFQYAEGFLPMAQVKAACGDDAKMEAAQKACRRRELGNGGNTLINQHLFNVYIHVGLNNQEFKGFPKDSLWYNRDIIERVQVEWGRHSLVTATRNIMKLALQEPRNMKLILLSEAGIPLYPPTALYHQLITEEKSRINSCTLPGWERHSHRWSDRMETTQMKANHWRKSSQWFGISRAHAELVMADTVVNKAFHDHCYPTTEEGWWRDCFSDEHYFATLLAVLGKENETDCKGFMMHVDWSRGGAHPRTYELREISAARLRLLRMPTENCGYPSAIKTAAGQFIKQAELNATACSIDVPEYAKTLGPQCPLFARKFAPETAGAITSLISECKNRLKIVHGNECHSRLAMLKKYM